MSPTFDSLPAPPLFAMKAAQFGALVTASSGECHQFLHSIQGDRDMASIINFLRTLSGVYEQAARSTTLSAGRDPEE
jgi:hypothetical protein